ncbi:unnamed protein product, partial [Notodromas monacha]
MEERRIQEEMMRREVPPPEPEPILEESVDGAMAVAPQSAKKEQREAAGRPKKVIASPTSPPSVPTTTRAIAAPLPGGIGRSRTVSEETKSTGRSRMSEPVSGSSTSSGKT